MTTEPLLSVAAAARALGVDRTTVLYHLRKVRTVSVPMVHVKIPESELPKLAAMLRRRK
jgi:hypothetical protein